MDIQKLTRFLDSFKNEPGLVMPPVQLYATQLALSDPPYNTGLFNNLHGRPVVYLNELVDGCVEAAEKSGLVVVEDFRGNAGNHPVDAPQVCSLMASALGEMTLRYGIRHQKPIHQWVHDSFDRLLPPLMPAHRTQGAAHFKEISENRYYHESPKFRAMIDNQAESLESQHLVSASDFLILRASYMSKAMNLLLKVEDGFEP